MAFPTVGRIVHYVGDEACLAAIVTAIDADSAKEEVSLAVVGPTDLTFDLASSHDEEFKKVSTWHWPERAREAWES